MTAPVIERAGAGPTDTGLKLDPLDLYRAGFDELVSVIPPGAPLSPKTDITPEQRGKAPGRLYRDGWGGYGWRSAGPVTDSEVKMWQRWRASVGLNAARFPGLDIDCLDSDVAAAIEALAKDRLGFTAVRTGRWPKRLLPYRSAAPFPKIKLKLQTPDGEPAHVEFLGDGQQYLVAGVHPETRADYTWDADLTVLGVASLPEITEESARAFMAALAAELPRLGCKVEPDPAPSERPPAGPRLNGSAEPWAAAALRDEADALARMAKDSGRNDRLNRAAFSLGQLVAGGHLDEATVRAELLAAADRCGLWRADGPKACNATFNSGFHDGMKQPRHPPERDRLRPNKANRDRGTRPDGKEGKAGDTQQQPPGAEANAADGDSYSAADLEHREFPPEKYVIPGIVTEGLTVLGGRPKLGKSALVLGWAVAVASGTPALDKIPVEAGDVLYAALEDNPRRMQKRLRLVCRGEGMPARLAIRHRLNRLDDGGLDTLRDWLRKHPNARLVIIDTWAKVKPVCPRGANAYEFDYLVASALQQLAAEFGVALVVVTHLRKSGGEDVFDEIGGTAGLPGAADNLAVLKRERGQADAVLHITGREIENDGELALRFKDLLWSLLGDATEYRQSKERIEIIRLLGRHPDLTPKEIAERLGKKREAVRYLLHRLSADGFVASDAKDRYRVSASPPEAMDEA